MSLDFRASQNLLETLSDKLQKPVNLSDEADRLDYLDMLALPPNWTLHIEDNEKLLPQPRRKTGTIALHDSKSFIAYLQRHKVADLTTIYALADYIGSIIEFHAIIDDHNAPSDGQQWRQFRANYIPEFSVEWQMWTKNNGKKFSQSEFGYFLEDHLEDIAQAEGMPTGAQLLEMALNFEAKQDLRFKSAVRLQSGGVQMNFVQDDDDQTLSKMQMFDRLAVGIPVFWGGSAYRVDARFRYRVKEGTLVFWYELIRPERIMEAATGELIGHIKEATELPFYFGSAGK